MKDTSEEKVRGLTAIQESRERRRRFPAIPARFVMWTATILVAWGVYYWKKTQGEIESQKARLFAQQRGVVAAFAPKVEPLQQRVEQWTVEAASKPFEGDLVTPQAAAMDLGAVSGVYLRLRVVDGTDAKKLRRAASGSLRDGFTSCLFGGRNADPFSGPACRATRDCPAGTFCNEADHCAPAGQPYNMRVIYRATRVLSDEWTVSLRSAGDDMSMRLLEREFEGAVRDDIPLAVDLLARAQFFLLVLDETSADGKSAPPLDELEALPHEARVFLWSIRPGQEGLLARLRRQVHGKFLSAGEHPQTDPDIVAAQQRQVNNCQLAFDVRGELQP